MAGKIRGSPALASPASNLRQQHERSVSQGRPGKLRPEGFPGHQRSPLAHLPDTYKAAESCAKVRPAEPGLVRCRVVPEHVWIGTSVENQAVVSRIRQLRQVPARVRFLSCEPLIGPLEFDPTGIHWVIVGGESGLNHRSMDPEWVRAIRDRCVAAGVPFFFKQWGGRTPKAGGRELDGYVWDGMPLRSAAGAAP